LRELNGMSFMWSALSMPMQNRLSRFTP